MEFRSVIVGRREKLAAPWPAVWSSSDSTKVRVHEYERGWLSAVDIGTADITASEVGMTWVGEP